MKLNYLLIIPFIVLSFFSCNSKKEESKESKKEISKMPMMKLDNGTYSIVKVSSMINWQGSHLGKSYAHKGAISISDGSLKVEEGSLSSGTFEIDMTSITCSDIEDASKNADLVEHLKSDDFFAVEKFPKATFVIKEVKSSKKSTATHQITGDLTIKDKTNSITFDASIAATDGSLAANAKTTIDRTKWDVNYGSKTVFSDLVIDKTLSDDIELSINIIAKK